MIEVSETKVIGNQKVVSSISCANGAEDYFSEPRIFTKYGRSIENVPESTLSIPAVATLAPIAWATPHDLHVPSLDSEFVESLDSVRREFSKWYPSFEGSTTVHTTPEEWERDRDSSAPPLLLFSGGVDSLTSYVRHQSRNPTLVPIQGADIRLENGDGWSTVLSKINAFAQPRSSAVQPIKSNIREVVIDENLHSDTEEEFVGGWWGGIQHGLGCLGLTAPLTYAIGSDTVIIGSTHTEDYSYPWGSHPSIDGNVRWGGSTVLHDGFELNRQEKIGRVADFVKNDAQDLQIRSCFTDVTGRNCSKCEKCCRTILGLEINGLDPNDHGYDVTSRTFDHIRTQLETGGWSFGADEEWFWNTIKEDASPSMDPPHAQAGDLFRWLQTVDMRKVRERSSHRSFRAKVGPHLRHHLPKPVFNAIKGINDRIPV